ncbi:MAG: DUF2723 domain-containing protein [Caldilineaceae bacterium]
MDQPRRCCSNGGVGLSLYIFSMAPGLTWANFGADGSELLAAAVTNGVPHPPGYPLYTLLLQGWLALWAFLLPNSDLAWRGNLSARPPPRSAPV